MKEDRQTVFGENDHEFPRSGCGSAGRLLRHFHSVLNRKRSFFDVNPILAGFLTALITAALFEEPCGYILFRPALIKNEEVISWPDVIIAAVIVGIGFTVMEDADFTVTGGTNILRAAVCRKGAAI